MEFNLLQYFLILIISTLISLFVIILYKLYYNREIKKLKDSMSCKNTPPIIEHKKELIKFRAKASMNVSEWYYYQSKAHDKLAHELQNQLSKEIFKNNNKGVIRLEKKREHGEMVYYAEIIIVPHCL